MIGPNDCATHIEELSILHYLFFGRGDHLDQDIGLVDDSMFAVEIKDNGNGLVEGGRDLLEFNKLLKLEAS